MWYFCRVATQCLAAWQLLCSENPSEDGTRVGQNSWAVPLAYARPHESTKVGEKWASAPREFTASLGR